VATLLAEEYNKRILYIDLDTQGTSSDIIDAEFELTRNGVSRLYKLGEPLTTVIEKTKFENIDLITNSVACNDIHHYLENSKNTGAINALSDIIDSNLKFLNDNYDYIFIDFAPQTHSLINKSGFICVDSYVYLTYPEKSQSTITGITSFEFIYETQLAKHRVAGQKKALLINKYKEKDKATKEFIALFDNDAYKELKDIKLDSVIHEAVSVGHVVGSSKVLQETDHKRLYCEYRKVIDELVEKKLL
jgi:cellulose biosynthesis protein BcsQ